jgi:hypothetical protein
MEYLIRISRLGGKALINAVAVPDDKTCSFEIRVQEYISQESITQSTSASDLRAAIKGIFLSSERMADLSSLFRVNLIQKLAPGIHKEGYEDTARTDDQSQRRIGEQTAIPPERDPLHDQRPDGRGFYPQHNPLAAVPRRPRPAADFPPPGFEDEQEMNTRPGGFPTGYGPSGRQPLNIGERDLYPPGLGPHDPLRMGPGAGGHFTGGGGMHPTFEDSPFANQSGSPPLNLRAPPGARYDPTGPGDVPPHLRGFPRSGGGGSNGRNPFGNFGSGDFI